MVQEKIFTNLLSSIVRCDFRQSVRHVPVALLILITIVFAPGGHASTRYALLVGVSEYPNLDEQFQLDGPKYDVMLARDYLIEYGFKREHMEVLADGVDKADGLPTSAAIMNALKKLAENAESGDFVYLHFAGHGSQQPVSSTASTHDELDGLDEIFLPRDVKTWSDDIGMVENAIVDDHIRDALAAIRASGAFVWLVFDSCHSGTMSRSAASGGDQIKMRDVKPHSLGIPTQAMQRAAQAVRSRGAGGGFIEELPGDGIPEADGDKSGGFVAFYAARTTETTPEMMLPKYHPDSEPHGLFSYTLFNTLSRFPGATYRQVIHQVLQEYGSMQWRATTPLYEGSALDAPVFDDTPQQGQEQQWRFERKGSKLKLHAGTLHEVTNGSILSLATSAAAEDEIIGHIKVTRTGLLSSSAEITSYDGKTPVEIKSLPKAGYARLVEVKTDFTLRVSRPADEQLQSTAGKRVNAIMQSSGSHLSGNALVAWVQPDEAADVRLAVDTTDKGSLWLLPPTELLEKEWRNNHPKIRLTGRSDAEVSAALMDNLSRIAKVRNLLRLAKNKVASSKTEFIMSVDRAASGAHEEVALGTVPRFYDGDALELRVRNTSRTVQDVTILFIGADYSIQPLFPLDGEINRVESGDELVIDGVSIDTSETVGREKLIVIATQARPGSPMEDFGFLAQSGVPKDRDARGQRGAGSSVRELLKSAGFGTGTSRGAGRQSRATSDKLSIITVDWTTVADK